ncbi:MAG: ABC transporter permease [Roseinatronobacter sp.]
MSIPTAQRPASSRFRFIRSFVALVVREMTTTYARSPGGYLWAILEPVGGLILLTIVFSYISRTPALGNNFMYFFAGGILPFGLYMTLSNVTATSVRFSKGLLEYPSVSFMDAVFARFALNAITQLLIMAVVLSGVVLYYDLRPILDWPSLFLAIAMALSLAFGVGVLNCFLITSFPVWERVWAIMNRPMFLISGIFYIPEILPPNFRGYLLWNPLIHITSQFRKGLFSTYDAVYVNALYVFVTALLLSILGLIFLRRYYRDMLLK